MSSNEPSPCASAASGDIVKVIARSSEHALSATLLRLSEKCLTGLPILCCRTTGFISYRETEFLTAITVFMPICVYETRSWFFAISMLIFNDWNFGKYQLPEMVGSKFIPECDDIDIELIAETME